jgi:hypothetical protein
MFKKKVARVAALVLLVTGAAVLISCQEQDGPTGFMLPETDAEPAFYGYVYHGISHAFIDDADVKWECMTCSPSVLLGEATSGEGGDPGYYDISTETWFTSHDEHDLRGTASKSGFDDAYAYIEDYVFEDSYPRDFYLYPSK